MWLFWLYGENVFHLCVWVTRFLLSFLLVYCVRRKRFRLKARRSFLNLLKRFRAAFWLCARKHFSFCVWFPLWCGEACCLHSIFFIAFKPPKAISCAFLLVLRRKRLACGFPLLVVIFNCIYFVFIAFKLLKRFRVGKSFSRGFKGLEKGLEALGELGDPLLKPPFSSPP